MSATDLLNTWLAIGAEYADLTLALFVVLIAIRFVGVVVASIVGAWR